MKNVTVIIGGTGIIADSIKLSDKDIPVYWTSRSPSYNSGHIQLDVLSESSKQQFFNDLHKKIDRMTHLSLIFNLCDYSNNPINSFLINSYSVYELTKEIASKGFNLKNVIYINTIVSKCGTNVEPVYAASKASAEVFLKSLAYEIPEVRFNNIIVGNVIGDSGYWFEKKKSDINYYSKVKSSIPSKNFISPIEISHVISFLLDPQSENIRNTSITIDGGFLRNF